MKKIIPCLVAMIAIIDVQAQNLPVPKLVKKTSSIGTSDVGSRGIEFNGKYYFCTSNALWVSDGTDAGTSLIGLLQVVTMKVINNKLFIVASTPSTGTELWVSDGTAGNTKLVKDINTSGNGVSSRYESGDNMVTVLNNDIYFYGNDGVNGVELWKSDGTASGTKMVKDINQTSDASIIDTSRYDLNMILTTANGKVFFAADDGTNGPELWVTDGTEQNTVMLKDVFPGPLQPSSKYHGPRYFMIYGNKVVFSENENATDVYLYITDGTTAGTNKVSFKVDPISAYDYAVMNNKLYFIGSPDYVKEDLWVTDGTDGGTNLVCTTNTSYSQGKSAFLTILNNTLLFAADADPGTNINMELFSSDGVSCSLLTDLTPYNYQGKPQSSYPYNTTAFGGKQYFYVSDSNRAELYVTDGTASGTKKILYPNTDYKTTSQGIINSIKRSVPTRVGNSLYFWNAYTNADGISLYKLDMFADEVQDINKNDQVVLYPNPAADVLNVQVANGQALHIYNMSGMLVSTNALSGSNEVNIASLPQGMYTAVIMMRNGEKQYSKFIKQ